MATFLFDKTIFGPVKSRRLGISLGVNLLPNSRKVCNFNCIYCECGWNPDNSTHEQLPTVEEVEMLLNKRLAEMNSSNQPLDVITFAGNGEPTMHPHFSEIIDITMQLRDKYFPKVEIAVLSNATLVFKTAVFEALKKVDKNILKIDSAFDETCRLLNKPISSFSIVELVKNLKKFDGNLIIQTMFLKGNYEGILFDNTTDKEVNAWLAVLSQIKPSLVMIYTIERDTPSDSIIKIPIETLSEIASKVKGIGFNVSIAE